RPAVVAPVVAAPAAARGRTASAALRALQPLKATARPNRPPTAPPPMVAPAVADPSAAAAVPTGPEAEPGSAAAAPPPVDQSVQGVPEPPEPTYGTSIEEGP